MKESWLVFLILSSVLFYGCEKEEEIELSSISCTSFTEALIEIDPELVGSEINPFLQEFRGSPTKVDNYGHEGAFEALVEEINSCPNLVVVSSCYNCVYTNPPQSEIQINITDSSQELRRTLGLQHKDGKFIFVGIHD